jgi:repressor LexA
LRGLKQADLVERTGIGKSSISTYIAGAYEPKQKNLHKIAAALDVDPAWLMGLDVPMEAPNMISVKAASTVAELWAVPLIDAYTAAPEPTQENVCTLLRIDHVVPDALPEPAMCEMIVFDYPAAAGLPLYAESDFERVSVPDDDVPVGADFGIRISGDSMEPTIEDGCIVWVHKQSDIRDGEIGIFMLADSAVCKRARLNGRGRVRQLESDNSAYEPITGSNLEDLRVVGKVLL